MEKSETGARSVEPAGPTGAVPLRIESGEALVSRMASENSTCLLSFSRGKDSIAAYLAIRDKFERVVPYFYNVVPGLEFIEESLTYYEQKMGTHIIRLPAPGFYRQLEGLLYQPPDTVDMIRRLGLDQVSHDDLQEAACEDAGVDYATTYNALGMRAKDSMQRALYFQKNGPVNHNRKLFYPVWDWDKQRIIDAMRHAGWRLPIDYRYFSASFDGLYLKFMLPIKRFFPNDWEKIVNVFPLIELEVMRFESAVASGEQAPYVPPRDAKVYVPNSWINEKSLIA